MVIAINNFIDTLFGPVLGWLSSVSGAIRDMSVPVSRPLNFGRYFGYFSFLGPAWMTVITTACVLAFIYFVTYFVVNSQGLYQRFKDSVKWW